jgi:predicted PurR-regulated permease PerM
VSGTRIHSIQKAKESGTERPAAHETSLDVRTISLVIIAAGVTIFLLQQMEALLAPMAFGVLLFYALDPVVDFMETIKIPRWIGAAIALVSTLTAIGAGAYALQDQALTVINQLPAGARHLAALVRAETARRSRSYRKSSTGSRRATEDRYDQDAARRRPRAG